MIIDAVENGEDDENYEQHTKESMLSAVWLSQMRIPTYPSNPFIPCSIVPQSYHFFMIAFGLTERFEIIVKRSLERDFDSCFGLWRAELSFRGRDMNFLGLEWQSRPPDVHFLPEWPFRPLNLIPAPRRAILTSRC